MVDGQAHAVHGGAFFEAIGEEFGDLWRRRDVINADVLDAWYDPAPGVIDTLREHLDWLVKTSPPTHCSGLIDVISRVRGVPRECLVAGGGSSALMYQAIPRLLSGEGPCVILDPTYGEYEHLFAKVLGLPLKRVRLDPDRGFQPGVAEIVEAARGAALVALVNPNSPTGAAMSVSELEEVMSGLGPEAILWVDETYVDFAKGRPTLERRVAEQPRLIVSKSMSKYYALSGMRVAYLACHASIAAKLAEFSPPWAIGLPAQVAAVRALEDEDYYRRMSAKTAELRTALSAELAAIPGIRVFPSTANFVLMEVTRISSGELAARTQRYGVFLRDCDSLSDWFEGRYVRTAVKDQGSNDKIMIAIRSAMSG